jgi:hypothetical protein
MAGWTWGWLPAVAAAVLGTASSYAVAQAPLHPYPELDRIEFILENASYQILVPRKSRLSAASNPGCVKIWHPLSLRLMIFLELCSASKVTQGSFAKQAMLTDRIRVRYNINYDIGSGSGGTEGELKGELDLAGKVFTLTCRDQGEWGNNPDWCLHYLRYLEVKDRN